MRSFWNQNRFLALFAILSSLMGVSVGMARVATSLYALELHASESVLGLIGGAQSFGTLAISLPVGFLVDHLGPRRLFTFGTILAGAVYVVLPLVPSPTFLLACTALIGFFMPLRFIPLNAVFMAQLDSVGEARAGWYRGTHMIGMLLIGPSLAAAALTLLKFAGTFWLVAALFAVTLAVSPIVFGRYAAQPVSRGRPTISGIAAQLGQLGHEPELRAACLVAFCVQAINSFYGFFIVIIAITALHVDAVEATKLVAAHGGSFVFALFFLGGAVTRLGRERVIAGCSAGIAVALILLGLGSGMTTLFAGGLLLGLGLGLLQTANLTRFARLGARLGRGAVSGLDALFGPLGGLTGSIAGGLVGQHLGLQRVFLVATPLCALLLLHGATRRAPLAAAPSAAAPTPD